MIHFKPTNLNLDLRILLHVHFVYKLKHFKILSGAAYAQCENELKQLVEGCKLPFLPTPMGKGTLPDEHPLCVAPARSK